MAKRKSWMTALLGGACTLMILAPQADAQRPRAAQTPPQDRAAAGETLRLPPDQPIVILTVQSPREVRVGRSFEYQIRVQNNSQNIAVHDLVIAQHADKGFEIEASEVQGKPAGTRDQQAGQERRGQARRQQQRVQQKQRDQQEDRADQSDNQQRKSDEQKAKQEKQPEGQGKSDDQKSDDQTPDRDQPKSDEARDDSKSDNPRDDDSDSQEAKSDDAKNDDAKNDDAKNDDAKNDDAKNDDAKSDDAKRDDSSSDEAQEDAAQGDETKRERSQSDDSRRDRSASKSGQSGGSRWKIDRLMPGESRTIKVTAASDSEGAGNVCVAVESYVPAVCLTTRFTKPELDIEKKAPATANICDEIQFEYLVKNTGTGDLQRFTVRDDLPEGLRTIDGAKKLQFTLDDGLKAGATRKFVARLRASDTGEFTSRAVVEGSEGVEARSNRAGTKVQKADLAIAIDGPQAQEVGGLANYTVRVTNRGDAPAPGTQLRVYFPRSADLVRAGQPTRSSREVTRSRSESSRSEDELAAHDHRSQAKAKDEEDSDDDDDEDKDQDKGQDKSASAKADDQEDQKQDDRDDDAKQAKAEDDDDDDNDDDDKNRASEDRAQAKSQDQQPAARAQDPQDRARRAQSRENAERQHMAQNHWQLGTLAPGQTVEVTYVLRPYEGGDLEQMAVAEYVCATAQDREMLQAETKTATEILMLTGLRVTVIDDHDPVPVGQNVTYTITVLNQGNAPAHDIEIVAKLPKELKYLESKGASTGEASDNEVDFKPVETLEPGQKAVWQISASVKEGVGEKTQSSIEVELNSEDLDETITSQEPTTLFEAEKRTAKTSDEEEPEKK